MKRLRLLLLGASLLAACTESRGSGVAPESPSGGEVIDVRLVPVPASVLGTCVASTGTGSLCPTALPEVDGTYRIRSFQTGAGYRLADISFSGPYPRLTRKNAPPRFVHVVVKAGDLSQAFPFDLPTPSAIPPDLPRHSADVPRSLGRFTWGTKTGLLTLAPTFPAGGIDGGHLVFTWTAGETDYAVSLHAWLPLQDAVSTLQGVVASIP
jgi:hypothetical protein